MAVVARKYGWYAPLVAIAMAGVLIAWLAPPVSVTGHGSGQAPGVLAPGSSGSVTHHPWWDPRGWFGGGGGAPGPRTMAAGGGPMVVGFRGRWRSSRPGGWLR